MLQDLLIAVFAFILAFFDCFIVGTPPVSPTIGAALMLSNNIIFTYIACALAVGTGTTVSVWFFRTLGYRFLKVDRFKKVKKWQLRVSIIIDNIGYYIIVPFAATSLTMAVSVAFLMADHVNFKKFWFFMTLGRSLILLFFTSSLYFVKTENVIPLVIACIIYFIVFSILLIVLIKNRYVFKIIKEQEHNLTLEENE